MNRSKVTEQARRRMASKPAWQQRKEAIEFYERIKSKDRELPDREDVPDSDDASYRRERFM